MLGVKLGWTNVQFRRTRGFPFTENHINWMDISSTPINFNRNLTQLLENWFAFVFSRMSVLGDDSADDDNDLDWSYHVDRKSKTLPSVIISIKSSPRYLDSPVKV